VIFAHRLAFAVMHGVDAFAEARLFGHRCDNPLCQQVAPDHARVSSAAQNRRECPVRRNLSDSPRAGPRGPRRRARELPGQGLGRMLSRSGLAHEVVLAAAEEARRRLGRELPPAPARLPNPAGPSAVEAQQLKPNEAADPGKPLRTVTSHAYGSCRARPVPELAGAGAGDKDRPPLEGAGPDGLDDGGASNHSRRDSSSRRWPRVYWSSWDSGASAGNDQLAIVGQSAAS
jgi:hypothetical protein